MPRKRKSRGALVVINPVALAESLKRYARPAPDLVAHARMSRRCWMERAREAKRDGGTWGMRSLAECVEGARAWNRRAMELLNGRKA